MVEFFPSSDHAAKLPNGQPVVLGYELLVYHAGGLDPYLRVDLGKPTPQADGIIRVDYLSRVPVWPFPDVSSVARVAAIGPSNTGVSTPSSTFLYYCGLSLSSATRSFTAASGSGTFQVTAAPHCSWRATSSAPWITVTAGATGAGSASVGYAVAANTSTTSRTGTLVIGGIVHTITQAAGSSSTSPTSPGSSTVSYLGDMAWTSATSGWGPVERNLSNGEQGSRDGRTITLNGVSYTKGLGAHSNSDIRFPLNGTCSLFQAEVGVDDEVGAYGSVAFRVLADGVTLFDSGLMTGVTATRTVQVDVSGRRELALVITNADGNPDSDHGDWASARITCATSAPTGTSTQTYVSSRVATSGSNGWGPIERDRSNGEQGATDGTTITLNGQTHAKGLGVHAPSQTVYTLAGACTLFQAEVGVDDEVGSGGSVVFQVWADGVKLFDSGTMTGSSAARSVTVDVTGRSQLTLTVTDAGDGVNWDHADWAGARVTCTSGGF